MTLEICCYNLQSCHIAQQAGAHRIELCASPHEGGTTPSYGMLAIAISQLTIPIFPMIRPRGGNFIYTPHEVEAMLLDIQTCKNLGYQGIVAGCLTPHGTIDVPLMSRIVQHAHPMSVTFHKAFDRTTNPLLSLQDVIDTGCTRLLTSGGAATATLGLPMLQQLITAAAGRITIMPGGGVRSSNLAALRAALPTTQFHSSGIISPDELFTAHPAEVAAMVATLAH